MDVRAAARRLARRALGERGAALLHGAIWAARMPRHALADARRGDAALAARLVRPGDTCVDVGAHGGAWTWLLARAAGPAGRVHAIEALPRHAAALGVALRLRGLRGVLVHATALADAPGRRSLVTRDASGRHLTGRVHLRAGGEASLEEQAVPCTTLDLLAEEHPELLRTTFLKVDVEGAERLVLAGARRVLAAARPALLLELDDARLRAFGSGRLETLEELASWGYAAHVDDGRALVRVAPTDPRLTEDVLLLPVSP